MELISRTKGSDFGGELKIANGAAARWVEEKEGREKERRKEEEGEPYSVDESRHGGWCDSFVSRTAQHGVTRSTFDGTCLSITPCALAPHESHQCTWLDSFKISFGPVYFSIFFKKKSQNTKIIWARVSDSEGKGTPSYCRKSCSFGLCPSKHWCSLLNLKQQKKHKLAPLPADRRRKGHSQGRSCG
jgi:hypothetical protein